MTSGNDLTKCQAFIGCHLNPPVPQTHPSRTWRPGLTISRQTGSGSLQIARRLAEYLQARHPVPCNWTVFDKNLVTKMLEEHNLPRQLAEFIPEDRISHVRDMMEELLGLHPPSETLIRQISETVMHLAEFGYAILVGRAANVITRHMKNVFHVRLVAPLQQRVAQVMAKGPMAHDAALNFIRKEDRARKRYLRRYFQCDPDDILLYDLVVNTARFSTDAAARLIGDAFLDWAANAPAAWQAQEAGVAEEFVRAS